MLKWRTITTPHKITAILAMVAHRGEYPIFVGAPDNSDYSGQNVRERRRCDRYIDRIVPQDLAEVFHARYEAVTGA